MQRKMVERLPMLDEDGPFGDRIRAAKKLPLVYAGDPVLRDGTQPVTTEQLRSEEVQTLIARMVVTMREAPGVGLAAPQVGSDLCIAVIEDQPRYTEKLTPSERIRLKRDSVPLLALINPVIERCTGSKGITFQEGCLSVPGYVADVKRESAIQVKGLDIHGQPFFWKPSGWPARIAQHEVDHLRGLLYIDKMQSKTFAHTD